MTRALAVFLLLIAAVGCNQRVDVHQAESWRGKVQLIGRRVKIVVREDDGRRHALVVDVYESGGNELKGRIYRDAIETRYGIWAEITPVRGDVVIPFAQVESVVRGPTGEEIAAGILAGICTGICNNAFK